MRKAQKASQLEGVCIVGYRRLLYPWKVMEVDARRDTKAEPSTGNQYLLIANGIASKFLFA